MNTSLETVEELVHRLTVRLPRAPIEREITIRIKALDWCPLSDEQEQNATTIRKQITSGVMHSSCLEAMRHYGLNHVGEPRIGPAAEEQDELVFVAEFEALPKIDLVSFKDIQISRPVATVTEQDIDHMLDSLREQHNQSTTGSDAADSDDALLQHFGIKEGGIQALRSKARKRLEIQLAEGTMRSVRQQIFKALLAKHPFTPPQSMVQMEYDRRMAMLEQRKTVNPDAPVPPAEQVKRNSTRAITTRLITQAVIKEAKIVIGPQQVRMTVENIASAHENPQEVIDQYYESKVMLNKVLETVMIDMAINTVADKATVTEVPASFSQVVPPHR